MIKSIIAFLKHVSPSFWFQFAVALGTWVLAIYTMKLANATKEMIRENSRTVWKNNLINAVSDYLGFVSSIIPTKDKEIVLEQKNIEKMLGLLKRIEFYFVKENESVTTLLRELYDNAKELAEKKMSPHVWNERLKNYFDLQRNVTKEIKFYIEREIE
jgi:hypothetical protein